VLAAGVSKTGVVGAVGGIELPSIKLFFEGFKRGFSRSSLKPHPDQLYRQFRRRRRGQGSGAAQISQGADVLIHNADAAGLGVFLAAEQGHAYAFGVFTNQNNLAPM